MKTLRILCIVTGGFAGLILVAVLMVRIYFTRAEENLRATINHTTEGPFAGFYIKSSEPYHPLEIHLDLQTISVTNEEDHSDERQVLKKVENETRTEDFPLMEVRWTRLVLGKAPEAHDFIYRRNALQLEYRIGNQPSLHSSNVKAMDVYGMAHAPTADIARDMDTLSHRK